MKMVPNEHRHEYVARRYSLRSLFRKIGLSQFSYEMGRFRSLETLRAKVQVAIGNGGLLPASGMSQSLTPSVDDPGPAGDTPRWLTITS